MSQDIPRQKIKIQKCEENILVGYVKTGIISRRQSQAVRNQCGS